MHYSRGIKVMCKNEEYFLLFMIQKLCSLHSSCNLNCYREIFYTNICGSASYKQSRTLTNQVGFRILMEVVLFCIAFSWKKTKKY